MLQPKTRQTKPVQIITLSFLLVIAVGTVLLMLPISSRAGTFTPFTDALFTATSATCVTGLIIYDTYTHWNIFGQCLILLMIQIGGLGLVTFTSFFNFAIGRKLGLRSIQLASESVNSSGFGDVKGLVRVIVRISLICEAVGAALLMLYFVPKYQLKGIFISIFLSISAFCNAGFDILGFEGEFTSLTNYADNPLVTGVIMLLIISGGLGFIVWHDLIEYRKTRHLMLHTKVVLITTGVLILLGTLCVLILEWSNPATLEGLNFFQKLGRSLFQSVTFRTAGFNNIDVGNMNPLTKIFTIIIMFIGAAPGSTAGGLKVTTFAVLIMTVVSVIKNKEDTVIMGRKIDKEVVYKSLSIFALAVVAVFITSCTLIFGNPSHNLSGLDAVFESVSAFATVGVSVGPTAVANVFSRIVLAITMFIGRIGPVSLALALTMNSEMRAKNQVIPEGKIIVG